MKNEIDNLLKASPAELMLRYKRASLVLMLQEIKKCEIAYEKETGNKAPSLLKLIKKYI